MLTPARFIDIHVLQSVPFANLNRDDTNSVKTVQYGNTLRTRVSSQSWKRAIRSVFEDRIGQAALRTRRIGERVTRELEQRGWPAELAQRAGGHTAAASGIKFELAKSSGDAKQTVPNKVLTNAMVYVPEAAVAELADLAEQHREELQQAKDIKKPADKSILPVSTVEAVLRSRNGVINLFGRMLAEINDAGVDGAVQVAHALTTHETDVELDYFSAVDDVTAVWNDATGSGHMGHAEFSAGTFYRYATLDLRNLVANIGDDPQAARELTTVFLASFITSLPRPRRTPPPRTPSPTWSTFPSAPTGPSPTQPPSKSPSRPAPRAASPTSPAPSSPPTPRPPTRSWAQPASSPPAGPAWRPRTSPDSASAATPSTT
ncbi:type I-E CRISPR-associated protein Cas7/Cse4/CasC [Streptomyces avermitilis]|uniref:Type I-E CRISPR-associated protein Cas7/Cse4/CasC n=1 Tax=Streptomyces avermitilis TaxID=33903 RepID=A0A4D4NBT7_STRAX|nr:type I-E CRISPR-associated protein Cas7/Cse4/CasC [Streptomyces avermitilis]